VQLELYLAVQDNQDRMEQIHHFQLILQQVVEVVDQELI
jgi:hypothetical protein